VTGVPLTEAAAFYGRQDVFRKIRDVLDAEQNVIVLYGQRRIGKTSVLHRAAQWLREQGGWFPVYFDLQGKERLSLGEVLANLAHTIARRLSLDKPDATLFDEEGRYFCDQFLARAFTHLEGRRLVLLFDEFDVLTDELASSRAASETLFPYLQDLIATQRKVGFVFVVGRRIEELATHFQAIFKQAVYKRVGHLTAEDSRALIVEPAQGLIAYDDDAVQEIQRLAAGHPYFTQLICFEAFNAVRANGHARVNADVIRDVVSRAIESGHGALNWFWEGLPRAERFILSAVAHASKDSGVSSSDDVRRLLEENRILLSGLELKDAPDRLVDWEMLRRDGANSYSFVVELVRQWVIQEHPLSNARRDIDYVNKRAVRLFENAREAHSAGDLPYARDEYQRTLKANPNHSGAQLGLALVLYELGELDDAIVEFERAYGIDEMSARDGLIRARLARAGALEKQSLPDKALLEYETVLRLLPTEDTALRRVGSIWMARAERAVEQGDLAASREAAREALRHDPSGELAARVQSALVAHAEASATREHFAQASGAYTLLMELLPDRPELKAQAAAFWVKGGELFEGHGELEPAAESFRKATALFPDDAVAAGHLAAVQQKLEERQKIGRIFEESLAAHRAGHMGKARDGWKKLIQMDVLSYEGENIATLLAETITPATETPARAAPPAERPLDREADAAAERNRPEKAADESSRRLEPMKRTAQAAAESATPDPDARSSELSELQPSTGYPESPRLRWVPLVVGFLGVIVFLTWPASLERVYVPYYAPVKTGESLNLYPELVYNSTWRRRSESAVTRFDYQWWSNNSAVASVDSTGVVKALAPGSAEIVASYRGVQGSTTIEVQASVVKVSLPATKPIKAGNTIELRPIAEYSGGARSDRDITASAFSWSSSNTAVATVLGGVVVAKAPGTARITASYGTLNGSTDLSVLPWDVPAMRAYVTELKFFIDGATEATKDRKYQAEFRTKTDYIWAELTLHFVGDAKDRALKAALYVDLYGSNNAKLASRLDDLSVPREWPGVVSPTGLGILSPDRYRVNITHGGRVIATGQFVVK
jgi:tetratricopeptide (TPR) repeat protein